MNLILTDKCTNSCPYCFAAQEMSRDKRKNSMTRNDFDFFIDFLSKSKEHVEINVIGGEPLIYDNINYVLDRLYAVNSAKPCKIVSKTVSNGIKSPLTALIVQFAYNH